MSHPVRPTGAGLVLVLGLTYLLGLPATGRAQPPGALITDIDSGTPTVQLDGLEWTFVRIKYTSWEEQLRAFRALYWSDPWAIDGPAAEQNLSRRLGRVTAIAVNGGTATFDDFHGPVEWETESAEMKRVFPEREIVKLGPDHPIFTCFYDLSEYPQIPGLGSFFNGVTWEKGGFEAGLYAILDDDGRAMALFNFNTDMGDGWEWSNAEDYPGYITYTGQAYRMMINEVVYALTH